MVKGLTRTFGLCLLTGLLGACGGGGETGETLLGGGTTGTGTGTDGTDGGGSINLVLVDGAGDAVTTINDSEVAIARATVLDSNGSAVSGVVVTFTADIGQISPDSGTARTNDSGVAQVTIGSGTTEGAGSVVAQANVAGVAVTSNEATFTSNGGGGSDVGSASFTATLAITTPDGSRTISRDNPGTATLTVVDAANPGDTSSIDGSLVQFSLGGAAGELTTTATFLSGATVSVTLLAGEVGAIGDLSATVTIGDQVVASNTETFISAGDGVPTVELTIDGGGGTAPPNPRAAQLVDDTISDSNTNPVVVTATVRDRTGAPVEGALVTFNLAGEGRLSETEALTRADGTATTTILAGTSAGLGSISATANIDGVAVVTDAGEEVAFQTLGDEPFAGEGSSNFFITIGLDTDNQIFDPGTGEPEESERELDADAPATLYAIVTQRVGNTDEPVSNQVVRFTKDGDIGVLFPANGSALTDGDGIARITFTAGTIPGAGVATAEIVIDGQTFDSDSITYSSLGNEEGDELPSIALTFNSIAVTGDETNIVTSQQNGTIGVRVTDGGGALLPNREIIVSTTLGSIQSANDAIDPDRTQTSIVSQDGTGTFTLRAPDGFDVTTGTVTVFAGGTAELVQFQVGIDGLKLGTCIADPVDCSGGDFNETNGVPDDPQMVFAAEPLSALGNTSVQLVVVDANNTPVPGIDIDFSSTCVARGEADITQTATSNAAGVVTALYIDQGCAETDTITATEASTGAEATALLQVLNAKVGSIRFVSVSPSEIQIKGTGTSSAIVTFQVLDVSSSPVEDATVEFGLTTKVGGLSLVGEVQDPMTGEISPANDLTDANGEVTAVVNAGFLPTPVGVVASVAVDVDGDGETEDDDTTLSTVSTGLSVNTGTPDQNSFSMSGETLNIEGDDVNGLTTNITVRLGDFVNNPVPDGTTVQFRTEYGDISPSCDTLGGSCTVVITSGEPRAPTDPNTPPSNVFDDSCPSPIIVDEPLTVDGSNEATTDYIIEEVLRVEETTIGFDTIHAGLTEDVHYTYNPGDNHITCIDASCINGDPQISYVRRYVDETPDDVRSTTPNILTPGVAAGDPEDFVQRTGVPCMTASRSADTVASGYLGGLGQIAGARSTVLAYTLGEEDFIDRNSNGRYDFGEPFVDLTEAFHDINEDDVFGNGNPASDDSRDEATPGCYGPSSPINVPGEVLDNCYQQGGDEETFLDFGDNDPTNNLKDLDSQFNAGNGIYNGTLCPEEVSERDEVCDNVNVACVEATSRYCTRDRVNIRRDLVIAFSNDDLLISVREGADGEFVSAFDIRNLGFGEYLPADGVTVLRTNDNQLLADADTEFTIGWGDGEVPPRTGETVSLLTGTRSMVVNVGDRYGHRAAVGTSISAAAGDDACVIANPGSVTNTLTNSNSKFPSGTVASLGEDDADGSGTITISATTPRGVTTTRNVSCTH